MGTNPQPCERRAAWPSGFGGSRCLSPPPPLHCHPAERRDRYERDDDTERLNDQREEPHEVAPRLLGGFGHDARAGMPYHGGWLVYADRERAEGRVRLQIAEPPLVALDLFAHPCQLLLDIQDVFELAGARGNQLDQPCLEASGVRHAGDGVRELLADVLGADVHRLEFADRCEPAQPLRACFRRSSWCLAHSRTLDRPRGRERPSGRSAPGAPDKRSTRWRMPPRRGSVSAS